MKASRKTGKLFLFKNHFNENNNDKILSSLILKIYLKSFWSVLFIFSTEFSKIDCCMTKWTEMKSCFLHLTFIHFMFASFTSVIISWHDGFSTDDTCREICSTLSATCIIFTYSLFTISSRAFYFFTRSFLRRMFSKYTDCHIDIFLSLLQSTHSLKFNECSWTLFIALK